MWAYKSCYDTQGVWLEDSYTWVVNPQEFVIIFLYFLKYSIKTLLKNKEQNFQSKEDKNYIVSAVVGLTV